MSSKRHLRKALLTCSDVAEARHLLKETYGEYAPSNTTCEDQFKRFRTEPKIFESTDL